MSINETNDPRPPANPGMRPQAREDLELLMRYRRHGDLRARERLVERTLPLVQQLARRYRRGHEPLDDVVQAGCVGLVKAIDRFDFERGSTFIQYAIPNILGEIRRHFRDTGWAAHVPRGLQERVMEVRGIVDDLSASLGRNPSAAEVASAIGAEVEDVIEAMEAASAYTADSLDAPRATAAGDGEIYADTVGSDDHRYALAEDMATVFPALRVLPERERAIIRMRFVEDLTQSQIARELGISQMHVSRLLRRALERVRTIATNDALRASDLDASADAA